MEVTAACPVQNTPPGTVDVALRARTKGLSPDAVGVGLENGQLVQAWSLHGTPHVMPAADLVVFTLGLAPADEDEARYLLRPIVKELEEAGITAREAIARTAAAIEETLDEADDGEGQRSKDDLLEALARMLPKGLNPWCARCEMHHVHPALQRAAALGGGVLIAPRHRGETHFVRTDRWLGATGRTSRKSGEGDAGVELVRRFLGAYGPSRESGLAMWTGIAPRAARRLWKGVAGELVEVEAAGERAWVLERDIEDLEAVGKGTAAEGVRLLPPNDPYLAQPDREMLVPDRARRGEVWRAAGAPGVLLVDGEVAGTWRSRKVGRRLEVSVTPFGALNAGARRRTAALAEDLAEVRGCEAGGLTWMGD